MFHIEEDLATDWQWWANLRQLARLNKLLAKHAEFQRLYPDITCGCGDKIAPALSRLGSVYCHDCRDLHRH